MRVFQYLDYRQFLRELYQSHKAYDKRFSCRFIASRVGFKSASFFSQVLHGRSDLTPSMALRFATFLKLDPRETDYFELLVLYARSEGAAERRRYLERLATFREAKAHTVPPEHFEFYACWYHTAIRELLYIEPFEGDHRALARRLRPAITAAQARESIDLLLQLGMARRDGTRVVRSDALSTTTGEAVASVQVDQFHESCLELSRRAIDGIPRDLRRLSTVTVTLSPSARARVEEEIAQFRTRLLAIAEADKDETDVWHLGMQFFPLTQGSSA